MFNASDLKKGDVVKIDGDPHIVETIKVQKPSARGAVTLYKIRFRNLSTKRKVDQSLHGSDVLEEADFERRPVQYLFGDDASITFMDLQDYGQFTLTKEEIEDELPYLTEGVEGIRAIAEASIEPVTEGLAGFPRDVATGHVATDEGLLVLLDLEQILSRSEFVIE